MTLGGPFSSLQSRGGAPHGLRQSLPKTPSDRGSRRADGAWAQHPGCACRARDVGAWCGVGVHPCCLRPQPEQGAGKSPRLREAVRSRGRLHNGMMSARGARIPTARRRVPHHVPVPQRRVAGQGAARIHQVRRPRGAGAARKGDSIGGDAPHLPVATAANRGHQENMGGAARSPGTMHGCREKPSHIRGTPRGSPVLSYNCKGPRGGILGVRHARMCFS